MVSNLHIVHVVPSGQQHKCWENNQLNLQQLEKIRVACLLLKQGKQCSCKTNHLNTYVHVQPQKTASTSL